VKLAKAFIVFDRLLMEKRGRGLEPIEREILTISSKKERYRSTENYQEQTIKNKASQLWKDLSRVLGKKIGKYNICQILSELDFDLTATDRDRTRSRMFFGRVSELYVLKSTIEVARQQVICLYGMPGIGKTALVRQYVDRLSSQKFDRVIWLSLADLPQLSEILSTIVKELAGGRSAKLARESTVAIAKAIGYIQQHRCLLIFDNADAILDANTPQTQEFRQSYLQFFAALNLVEHQSSCLLITRFKPPQSIEIERALELQGLDRQSCQELLENSDLIGTANDWEKLIVKYRGNPQQLKLVANTIRDIFDRQIAKFLAADLPIVARVELLISEQLNNLASAELLTLAYLSLQPEPVTLDRLVADIHLLLVESYSVRVVDRLVSKYLIEVIDDRFYLPDSIQAYLKLHPSKLIVASPIDEHSAISTPDRSPNH
jgi:GTPase SAR1 family protein